jgi:hypothetical protein
MRRPATLLSILPLREDKTSEMGIPVKALHRSYNLPLALYPLDYCHDVTNEKPVPPLFPMIVAFPSYLHATSKDWV